MIGFVFTVILIVAIVGGLFYGYSYLVAKSTKTSVVDALAKNATELIKKKPE